MRFGFLRFIRLLSIVMLVIFAGFGRPKAQTAYRALEPNGQASGQAKTQEVRTPATAPTEPPNKKEVVFSRHDDVVPSVAFSPDGKRLASAGDNCVKVTDLETGKELMRLKNSRGMSYFSVAYSPDGRTLAGAQSMLKEKSSRRTGDTTITTYIYFGEALVWDAQTGALKMTLNDDNSPSWALAFSPDGKWLAVAAGPTLEDRKCKGVCPAFGEITLWETGDWKLTRRLRASSAPIRALAFSPDGRSIAGGAGMIDEGRGAPVEDFKGEVFLWDVVSGDLKQKFPGHTRSVTSLAFSPDSRLLASAGLDRMLKIWDCHTYELKKMASDQMLSIEEMQTISDATGSKPGKNEMPPISWLNALSFSRDGKQIIGGSGDSIIRFYESESVKLVGVLKPRGWPIFNTMMTFYDPSLGSGPATLDIERQNRIIHRGLSRGMGVIRLARWPFHPGSLNSMALSPDGKTLAIGNFDGKIRLLTLK
jgi:WD40 repeat protein